MMTSTENQYVLEKLIWISSLSSRHMLQLCDSCKLVDFLLMTTELLLRDLLTFHVSHHISHTRDNISTF